MQCAGGGDNNKARLAFVMPGLTIVSEGEKVMLIEVQFITTRKKRIPVTKEPAFWQQFID